MTEGTRQNYRDEGWIGVCLALAIIVCSSGRYRTPERDPCG